MALVGGVNCLTTLKIFLTPECNLSCRYCLVNKSLPIKHRPSVVALCKAVDIFLSASSCEKTIDIAGGEPFLYFNELAKIVKYTRNQFPRANIVVTTNATLVNNRHLRFIKKYNVNLKISIDGVAWVHDSRRCFKNKPRSASTHKLVLKTLKTLIREKIEPKAVMTFGPQTYTYLYHNLRYLKQLGFEHIDFYPEVYALWTKEDLKRLPLVLEKISNFFIKYFKENSKVFGNALISMYFSGNKVSRCDNCDKISVDGEGNFYCCDKVFSLSASGLKEYAMGSVTSGINYSRKRRIIRKLCLEAKALLGKKCLACKFSRYCFCPVGVYLYAKNNNLDARKYLGSFCSISRIYSENFLNLKSKLILASPS